MLSVRLPSGAATGNMRCRKDELPGSCSPLASWRWPPSPSGGSNSSRRSGTNPSHCRTSGSASSLSFPYWPSPALPLPNQEGTGPMSGWPRRPASASAAIGPYIKDRQNAGEDPRGHGRSILWAAGRSAVGRRCDRLATDLGRACEGNLRDPARKAVRAGVACTLPIASAVIAASSSRRQRRPGPVDRLAAGSLAPAYQRRLVGCLIPAKDSLDHDDALSVVHRAEGTPIALTHTVAIVNFLEVPHRVWVPDAETQQLLAQSGMGIRVIARQDGKLGFGSRFLPDFVGWWRWLTGGAWRFLQSLPRLLPPPTRG